MIQRSLRKGLRFILDHQAIRRGEGTRRDRFGIALENIPMRYISLSPESKVERLLPDPHIHNLDVRQPMWKRGIHVKLVARSIRLQTKNCLEEGERRTSGPGLRHIGAEVLHREVCFGAFDSGIEFGHPVLRKVAASTADFARDACCLRCKAIPPEAKRDKSVASLA
jgi:hypothetical protein